MSTKESFAFSFAVFLVIVFGTKIISQSQKIERLESQPKIVVYEVKGAGDVIDLTGTITAKNALNGRYMVTINGYGNFLVNKEQYDNLKIGDPMPEYLKGLGS
ncbi:MAG: DUF1372 family protein [Streptococcus salivarius]|jgi:hypothetical protein|nr:MAG TPA: Protein of unknown function (DUF1372) [Caudoviricetes sp.]